MQLQDMAIPSASLIQIQEFSKMYVMEQVNSDGHCVVVVTRMATASHQSSMSMLYMTLAVATSLRPVDKYRMFMWPMNVWA